MDKLVKKMWDAYSAEAGGKSFDGKQLPSWDELGKDRQACWFAAVFVFVDRIYQLETALRYLIDECDPDMDEDYNPHAMPLRLARAALEGKDD